MQSGIVPTGSVVVAKPGWVWWSGWRRNLAIAIAVLAISYCISPFVFGWAGRWLNVGEQLAAPVDGVFVLGGEASTRPFLAAAIYRAGYARTVLIPGGKAAAGDNPVPAEHDLVRAVLLLRGVPEESIEQLPGQVDSTRDEVHALGEFLKSNPTKTIAIVTSDFHTRRTRLICRRMLRDHVDQLRFVACPTDGFGPENWWRFKDGLHWYVTEYGKLVRDFLTL